MNETKGFFTNQVVVKTDDQEFTLAQNILFNKFKNENGGTNLFSFIGDFSEMEGDEPVQTSKPILNIEKNKNGEYYVRIKEAGIFTNEDGLSFESLGIAKDGDDFVLKIDPSSPAVTMKIFQAYNHDAS